MKSAVFSPDDARVLTAGGFSLRDGFGEVQQWDSVTHQPLGAPMHYDRLVNSAVFSRDGRLIVTASNGGHVQVSDAATGNPFGKALPDGILDVTSAVFSADAKRVLTADARSAQLWDIATGEKIGKPISRGSVAASFSSDAQRIVTGDDRGAVQIWEPNGEPLGPPFRHNSGRVNSVAFNTDGTRILSASNDHTARVWEVDPPTTATPVWLEQFTAVMSGLRFEKSGELAKVEEQERVTARDKLRESLRACEDATPDETRAWQRLGRWALAPAGERQVTPGSAVSVKALAERELASGEEAGVRHALALAPNHPLVHIALAAFEKDNARANFLRSYDLRWLPREPGIRRQAGEMLRAQNQPELASRAESDDQP
ncbi:MAG: hypothetical protein M3Y69_09090 [Verrucomicrobiota bacterium]|nr:hypothetical protein [Verrucomicrobiota bacterium]